MKIKKHGKKWRLDYIADGIRHRVKFKTKEEADAEMTRVKSALQDNTYVDPSRVPTFEQLARDWFADRLATSRTPGHGYRPSSLAHWQSHIDKHLVPVVGNHKVNKIVAATMRDATEVWARPTAEGGHGLSPKTIAKLLTTASRIFRFGIAARFMSHNPVEVLETNKEQSGEQTEVGERLKDDGEVTDRDVLTPEESKRLILAAEPGLYRTIITTALYSGARHSELLALRWADVDLDAKVIHIRRTLSTAKVKGDSNEERFRWFDPKTKKGKRDIPMGVFLVNGLKDWREKCPKSRLDLVFSTEAGEPCHRSNILRYGLYPALERAKIEKNIDMHALRHTYASMLIMLGREIPKVSAYLGHADVGVTMRVYCHFINLRENKVDEMDDLESLVQNA
ncbi:MAG: site-specific integrase [Deltaproteobacteria bacterium]|nr:site-specific integrase [Deltaproteobacteria bacterium]